MRKSIKMIHALGELSYSLWSDSERHNTISFALLGPQQGMDLHSGKSLLSFQMINVGKVVPCQLDIQDQTVVNLLTDTT